MKTSIELKRPHSTLLLATLGGVVAMAASCGPQRVRPEPLKTIKPAPAASRLAAPDHRADRDDLIARPAARAPSPLKLPPLTRSTLASNGLKLLVLPDDSLPLVDVLLLVKAGAIDDPPDRVGLASYTAQMLRQGTRRPSADQLARRIDGEGASLQTSSGYEFSSVACSGRARSLELCLGAVAELVQQPRFPAKELGQVRSQLQGAIRETFDDPEQLVVEHFNNLLYGDDHPAGRPLSLQSIARITRDDLVRFHRSRYVPSEALLVISGAVDPARVTRRARALFGRWRGKKPPARTVKPVTDPPEGIRVLLVDKPDLTQSFFVLGHAGIAAIDPQRDAVRVMNYVLGGGGFSSRLMAVIRAQGGKTYSISSTFSTSQIDGDFSVQSFTKNAGLPAMLAAVRGELERIRREPPSAAEIAAAQGKIAGGYAIAFRTGTAIALALAEAQLRGLPDSDVTELAVRVARLSPAEIAAAARERVRPGRLVLAIVGKGDVVAKLLREAKIPFQRIGHLEPISARARRDEATRPSARAVVSEQELAATRRLLDRGLRVAGGRKKIASISSLRLFGKAEMKGKSAPYTVEVRPPGSLRMGLAMGRFNMLIVVDGNGGYAQMSGGTKRPLPRGKLAEMRAEIWRQPPLVLEHARRSDQAHRVTPKDLGRGRQAVRIWRDGQPTTLVFDRRARLVQLRYLDSRGASRSVDLGQHQRVAGVMVPHLISTTRDGKVQRVVLHKVEVSFKK